MNKPPFGANIWKLTRVATPCWLGRKQHMASKNWQVYHRPCGLIFGYRQKCLHVCIEIDLLFRPLPSSLSIRLYLLHFPYGMTRLNDLRSSPNILGLFLDQPQTWVLLVHPTVLRGNIIAVFLWSLEAQLWPYRPDMTHQSVGPLKCFQIEGVGSWSTYLT